MFPRMSLRSRYASLLYLVQRKDACINAANTLNYSHGSTDEKEGRHFSTLSSCSPSPFTNQCSFLFQVPVKCLSLSCQKLMHSPSDSGGSHPGAAWMTASSALASNRNPSSFMQTRTMSKKRKGASKHEKVESDEDSDDDNDDTLDEDDFDAPAKFKVNKVHLSSLRADAVLSHALGLARNRMEETFFGPGLLMNGKRMQKKGEKMGEGDFVDLVTEKTEGQLRVKRVKVLNISSEKTSTDKHIVKVRVWKSPFLIDDPTDTRHEGEE